MGLDQYAHVAHKEGLLNEFWEGAEMNKELGEYVNPAIVRPRELAYWRKHPNLEGFMANLYRQKHPEDTESFNGQELELTWEDLDHLERVVLAGELPATKGFFFGDGADEYYREQDLKFIKEARAEIFLGLRVFYHSSW